MNGDEAMARFRAWLIDYAIGRGLQVFTFQSMLADAFYAGMASRDGEIAEAARLNEEAGRRMAVALSELRDLKAALDYTLEEAFADEAKAEVELASRDGEIAEMRHELKSAIDYTLKLMKPRKEC